MCKESENPLFDISNRAVNAEKAIPAAPTALRKPTRVLDLKDFVYKYNVPADVFEEVGDLVESIRILISPGFIPVYPLDKAIHGFVMQFSDKQNIEQIASMVSAHLEVMHLSEKYRLSNGDRSR